MKNVSLDKFMAVVFKAAADGSNQSDIAKELGISQPAVSLRLKSLRNRGVKVPDFKAWVSANSSRDNRLISSLT